MSGTHDLSVDVAQQRIAEQEVFAQKITSTPYIYVTRNNRDLIEVDFTRNPFIAAEIEKNTGLVNSASVDKFFVPTFVATGYDKNGSRIYGERTVATFQPSQGLYQDIVVLDQTNNKFDAFEFLIPPEATTTFHTHTNGTELFYVLGGDPANDNNTGVPDNDNVIFELNADVDGVFNVADPTNPFSVIKDGEIEINGVEVTKGSFVSVPAGKIHTWANTGTIPARVIAFIVPGGIAEGFNTVGASAGIFDPSPQVHPILAANGTSNLIPTGNTPTEVNGVVPSDANFYDFFQQVAIAPDVLKKLSFTNFPTYLQDAGPVVVYGVNPDGSSAFKIDPSDDAGVGGVANPQGGSALVRDNSPGADSAVSATINPFANSSFNNPFTVLRFGQNDGILNPTPINTKLFSISAKENEYSVISNNYELFGVLSGEVIFEFGENDNNLHHVQVASEGDYVYVEPGNHFHLKGTQNGANLIQFSGMNNLSPTLETPVYRFQNKDIPSTYLYAGEQEAQNIRQNYPNFKEEGFAFNVSTTPNDELISLYRFQNKSIPGTYIYVGEQERQSIKQNYTNFVEEGLAFYAYGADANKGQDIYRFQNTKLPGTYIYVGSSERQSILANYPNFVEEGVAFEVTT
ncbi:hypothetical protein [Geminocystis sp. GBBB08]|uniref:hypothetical protein n=1 Tax=Geminocystis sp. GBBB08 TaxID=2604140 RepID=UPI0027E248DA|nr:hypothetical protein [Geminocystis sp. GBBB08]MBL1211581.1 cupin domain-containing protein [Geminocystis sp. GBBB08]